MTTAAAPEITASPAAAVAAPPSLRIKTILVPLDFSEPSVRVLQYAIPFASRFGADLHLVHVQPPDDFSEPAAAGHLMLNCAAATAVLEERMVDWQHRHDFKFWPDNCHVVTGRPFEEICRLATRISADLILLPTRGYGGLKHLMLGSTAERVARFAPCPVLVPRGPKYDEAVRDAATDGRVLRLREILVPIDFSNCARAGLRYAARLAHATGAALRLLHVVFPYAEVLMADRARGELRSLREAARANATDLLQKITRQKFLRGIPCAIDVRAGSAVEEICQATAMSSIDLMVISSHGRAGFQRAVLGSVAEQTMRYAACPVLIVPSRYRSS